jgi:N-dimethylarginine dimethylaminohydrolase
VKVSSHNEWDPLRAVVVGTVDGFVPGLEYGEASAGSRESVLALAREAFPKWYLDEVAEDLESLCAIFRRAGIEVLRPGWSEASSHFKTPNWEAEGFDIYNVRDLHIVFGNTIINSAPSSRFRLCEHFAFQELFYRHFFDDGFRWIAAPVPRLRGEYLHEIKRPASELEKVEDNLHQRLSHGLSEVYHYLDEDEVIFDAANIMRLGADVLFLVSSTGNRKAVRWLQEALGPAYRVHETHTYRSSHLDSTILPLREGAVLLNGARVSEQTCPEVLKNWDKLFFTDMAPVPDEEVEFHRTIRLPVYHRLKAMGVESPLAHISSPWAGLNVLSLDPTTVLVHDRQTAMIKALEAKGFTVIPVRMRHCYSMLGGLHCTTLDVVRSAAH